MGFPHVLASLVGAVCHLGYFRRDEHHLYPLRYVQWHALLLVGLFVVAKVAHIPSYDAVKTAGGLFFAYLTGLYTSLVIYRVHFHPLCTFPGPYGARFSGFWFSWSLRDRPAFRKLHQLHEEYGPVVRVGPSELSIIDPEAVDLIYGFRSRCSKSSFYDNGHPMMSLHSHRSRAAHDQRRRVWSTGFGDRALRGYETRIRGYREKLFNRLNAAAGLTVNVCDWFNFYSYDVMGDLAFARSFDMLDTSGSHWAIDVLLAGITPYKYCVPSWVFRALVTMPSLSKDWHRFVGFVTQRLVHRMSDKVEIPDICASFLDPLKGRAPTSDEFNMLMGDAMLVVTAGSDTTATTLTSIVYELARRPEEVEQLRAELLPIEPDAAGEFLHDRISQLPRLNGFINEAMRLHAPVPSIVPRKTPAEGIQVDGTHIPGDMTVFSPQWVVGRSDAAYVEPLSFIPERWYKYPDMIKHRSAFAPFMTGPYSCIGKPLALMNIRTTVARLITTFDIQFPAAVDAKTLMDHAEDHFTLGLQRMPIVFSKRQQQQ